ncbi:hypothetical protein B0J12DRAFT_280658 [Macrophomina phaseolina]|uniref:Uncharacterized protein n=1 Tax=Macrophomina phaseolina TaxID=35725 RepID=A0ABQ8GMU6_9PEZI|nr:hypothetical protein B0J12DRAFT_280658 [Macrophomina phaseolina]
MALFLCNLPAHPQIPITPIRNCIVDDGYRTRRSRPGCANQSASEPTARPLLTCGDVCRRSERLRVALLSPVRLAVGPRRPAGADTAEGHHDSDTALSPTWLPSPKPPPLHPGSSRNTALTAVGSRYCAASSKKSDAANLILRSALRVSEGPAAWALRVPVLVSCAAWNLLHGATHEHRQRLRIKAGTESIMAAATALQPWNVPFSAVRKHAPLAQEWLLRRSRLAQFAPGPFFCHCPRHLLVLDYCQSCLAQIGFTEGCGVVS